MSTFQSAKDIVLRSPAVFEPQKIAVSKEYELQAKVKKLTRKLVQKDEVFAGEGVIELFTRYPPLPFPDEY